MSRIGIGYDIGRFTGVCAATDVALEPGTPCIASLAEAVDDDGAPVDGFVRRDFSPAAWEAGHRPERLFSFWWTVVPNPDAPRRLLVDDTVLLDLIARLEHDERPARLAFRFVLALILLRRRQVRQVGRERTTVMLPPRLVTERGPKRKRRSASPTASAGVAEPELASGASDASGASAPADDQHAGTDVVERIAQEVDVWLLLPRGAAEGEEPWRVVDPRLGPEDITLIAEQLSEVLNGEL